jgi:ankyrin repeat protein
MVKNSMQKISGFRGLVMLFGLAAVFAAPMYGMSYGDIIKRYQENGNQYDDALDADIKAAIGQSGDGFLTGAVMCGNQELLNKLIAWGVDLNADQGSALLLAVGDGNRAMVQTLIAAGADVNATASKGVDLLTLALYNNQVQIALDLIRSLS